MTVYVALLRAIGPASHAKMRPSELRDRAEEAGFTDPVNYLATGNLILTSGKSAAAVKREITTLVERFGLDSDVFVATKAQVGEVVAANPFPIASAERPQRLGVCFFHKALDWPQAMLQPVGIEKVAAVGATLVIDYGPGVAASTLNPEKLSGARMTQRNWNTVIGIWQRMQDR